MRGFFHGLLHFFHGLLLIVDVSSKRWKTLRERYTKEHKKVKPPTGTGADKVEKEWQFYHLMDFLREHVSHRRYTCY